MSASGNKRDVSEVEALLRLRNRKQPNECCPGWNVLAQALQGGASQAVLDQAAVHLRSCSVCSEVTLMLNDLIAQRIIEPPAPLPVPKTASVPARSPGWQLRWAWAAGLATLALFAIALFVRFSEAPSQESDMLLKGPSDHLTVVSHREGLRTIARPMSSLGSGDAIEFFYSSERNGFLLVFAVDSEGRSAQLVPAESKGPQSLPIIAGQNQPLRDGATLEDGRGCEWVVAVFSDIPLRREPIFDKIGRPPTTGSCDWKLDIPGARRTEVIPFVRTTR